MEGRRSLRGESGDSIVLQRPGQCPQGRARLSKRTHCSRGMHSLFRSGMSYLAQQASDPVRIARAKGAQINSADSLEEFPWEGETNVAAKESENTNKSGIVAAQTKETGLMRVGFAKPVAMPENLRMEQKIRWISENFGPIQWALLGAVVFTAFALRPRQAESRFRVREADRPRPP